MVFGNVAVAMTSCWHRIWPLGLWASVLLWLSLPVLTLSNLPAANYTFYGYDDAGRSVTVTNALGQGNGNGSGRK